MKLSVIIITYMSENYIEKTLISALGQETSFDYEILVRDDFSSDNTSSHIKRISELNKRIKFFDAEENIGPNKNFEFLYSKAQGEYVAILDGDDYWDNMKVLQNSIDYLDNNPDNIMTFCGYREKWMNNEGEIKPPEITKWMGLNSLESDYVNTENILDKNYVGFGKVFRRIDNLIESWMYDLPYLDWGISYQLSLRGKIRFLNFPGGVYRVHDRGLFSGEDHMVRETNSNKTKRIIKLIHSEKS